MPPLDDRLLSPLYIPMALLFWGFARELFTIDPKSARKLIRSIILVGIFVGVWFTAGSTYVFARTQRNLERGVGGLRQPYWRNSETLVWLRNYRLNGHLYSNNPHAVYILTNYETKSFPTNPDYYDSSMAAVHNFHQQKLDEFKSFVLSSKKPIYLIWFKRHFRKNMMTPDKLGFCKTKLIKELRDGYVISLHTKENPDRGQESK